MNSQRLNGSRYRLDDDLTRIPPNYRIQRNWLEMNVEPLKGYRFYRQSSSVQTTSDTKAQENFNEDEPKQNDFSKKLIFRLNT